MRRESESVQSHHKFGQSIQPQEGVGALCDCRDGRLSGQWILRTCYMRWGSVHIRKGMILQVGNLKSGWHQ